jgi:hypothetical protein
MRAAFLGYCQAALALGLALGALRALLERGDLLAPQPGSVAGKPGAAPHEDAEQALRAGERMPCQPGCRHVRGEQRAGERQDERRAGA